ncbi:MAG: DNA mismatch repair endonuclease MutL [bacterium]
MAENIKQLPSEVINQIAAGEVIERPASVVKELLENAIDAGATEIEVEFSRGGVDRIEVRDNGEGIKQADLTAALKRHATSKIISAEDLADIQTLGFRGEALASISSVSSIKIVSRHAAESEALQIEKPAGGSEEIKPAGRGVGTTVTVSDLFENVPARRKFLATERTEKKHILEETQKKILAHPGIYFKIVEDGMTQLIVPPGDLIERAEAILGANVAKNLLNVDRLEGDWNQQGRFGFTGLISNGEAVHHNRRHQFIFVNSRPVREPVIYRAITRAYSDLALTSQHPVAIVFLDIPGDQLDVNVHPKKEEVRFNNSSDVFRFVYHTIKSKLQEHYQSEAHTELDSERLLGAEDYGGSFSSPGFGDFQPSETPEREGAPRLFEEERGVSGRARLIGQIKKTFLLVERDSGLLIIDQHVAHEKILYERYRRQIRERDESAQYLSVPLNLELSPADREVILDRAGELKKLGLTIEPFGGGSLVIQTVPGYLGRRKTDQKVIFDMIEEFLQWSREDKISNVADSMITIMSCRNAVKRGDVLMPREQQELIEGMNRLDFPAKCPHGRPIYHEIENSELARMFDRPLDEFDF